MGLENEGFFAAIEYLALNRYEGMLGQSGHTIKSVVSDAYLDMDFNKRSEICIYGIDVTVRLQIFFNVEKHKNKISHLYTDEVTDGRVEDFFNELANLTLGKIKEVMMGQGVNGSLSLPISISLLRAEPTDTNKVLPQSKDYSIQNSLGVDAIVRASFETSKMNLLSGLDWDLKNFDSTGGEVEFF